jgi:hypothetical protein
MDFMNMRQEIVLSNDLINRIYFMRNKNVMLDRDLADLYKGKAIRLREQVKRNRIRFPENFMFQLTDDEVKSMVSQNAIPSKKHLGGSLPYAFTEHGILMLANVLKSEAAIQVSIEIIEIFVKLRETQFSFAELRFEVEGIKSKIEKNESNIEIIFQCLDELLEQKSKPRRRIGFKFP